MTKEAKNKSNDDGALREVAEEPEEEEEEENAAQAFYNTFENMEEFVISLYRIIPTKGRYREEWLEDYVNEIPSFGEVREEYGAGTYKFLSKLAGGIRTLVINIGEKMKSNDIDKEDRIYERMERMAKMQATLGVGGGGGNNEILKMIVESMNKTTEILTKMMIEGEQRMMQTIGELKNSQRGGIKEIIETINLVDNLRGDRVVDEEEETEEGILNNPVFSGLIEKFLGTPSGNGESGAGVKMIKGSEMPVEFKEIVTRQNADELAGKLYETNKKRITPEDAKRIIEEICKERGL